MSFENGTTFAEHFLYAMSSMDKTAWPMKHYG